MLFVKITDEDRTIHIGVGFFAEYSRSAWAIYNSNDVRRGVSKGPVFWCRTRPEAVRLVDHLDASPI